jgi:hypothetical protein
MLQQTYTIPIIFAVAGDPVEPRQRRDDQQKIAVQPQWIMSFYPPCELLHMG